MNIVHYSINYPKKSLLNSNDASITVTMFSICHLRVFTVEIMVKKYDIVLVRSYFICINSASNLHIISTVVRKEKER